ncbi:MAG TPA: carboxypeptidase regulatory-like domain-containing protein [Vicinamibacterales bacterium]|nr:carboxypeptidase regulatory-like domain-containing protein [Vicinamibacterales bacterium]
MLRLRLDWICLFVVCSLLPALASAQQTGAISGKVTDTSGGVLPGVTVEATSGVLPTPRSTVTDGNGEFRLPALPPGAYTVTFVLSGMQTVTRQAQVQLSQDTVVDATLGVGGLTEEVVVTASATLVERDSAEIKSGVSNEQIMALPVGQDYRDLVRLIPGVQVTADQVRGPSAGGSGQDNVYQFDGVNVTLPLFGTLSAEPAAHDIAQVTTIKGGARAVDFDRSGGFTIDSVSKSGTNRYSGEISYQVQTAGMSAALTSGAQSRYEADRSWLTANVGGPVIPNRLHFYTSYYRPENRRENRANLYGPLPEYELTRDEGFGKVTLTPTNSVLLNLSYRGSDRSDRSNRFLANQAPSTGSGNDAQLRVGIAEGSWIIGSRSLATFKYTYFANKTRGTPDILADESFSDAIGTRLDVANLDRMGLLTVPAPIAGQADYNAFIQPLIARYGYLQDGVPTGGGTNGIASQLDQNDFFRDAGQVAYNLTLGSTVSHDLHFGYQQYVDSEDLIRSSNGWGLLSVPGGRLSFGGRPIFYTARFQQQSRGHAAPIHSEYRSQSIEVNDAIRWRNVTVNAGVLLSRDRLYGQGLREDPSTLSGFVSAPGNKYLMYEIPFKRLVQPRLGVTWAYNGRDTVYGSFARYNPAASSLPRAASWDRNLIGTFIDAHFDRDGVLFATETVGSSSGKLFVEDMTPRRVDEYLIGTARQFDGGWTARAYWRYREGSHFWEDTNNTARVVFEPPPGIPQELYIPNLSEQLAQIGSGSSYVIAELDGAYTKYYEATLEAEYRTSRAFVRGSYTWSHYYGNFDQDSSTTTNDANIFIGSSFIADGAGRQLWNFREGDLRGDRPHMLKLYGYYLLRWNATAGAFLVAQSGQPWEAWSYEPYASLTTSTSDTSRFAEPAGARRGDPHWQLDLNYTQNFRLADRLTLQIAADLFNVNNRQTGYNYQPSVHDSTFDTPRDYYDPRRFQLAARLRF